MDFRLCELFPGLWYLFVLCLFEMRYENKELYLWGLTRNLLLYGLAIFRVINVAVACFV